MNWEEMAVVGRVARTHGIRGQVIVNLETDFPHERFRPGGEVFVQGLAGRSVEALEIASVRFQNERPIVGFRGIEDINAADRLAGAELRVPVDQLALLPDGMFYRHDLIDCAVETVDGAAVGTVTGVEGTLSGSRLVVATERGEALVPLAADICRSIDPIAKRIVVALPEGLLELNA